MVCSELKEAIRAASITDNVINVFAEAETSAIRAKRIRITKRFAAEEAINSMAVAVSDFSKATKIKVDLTVATIIRNFIAKMEVNEIHLSVT